MEQRMPSALGSPRAVLAAAERADPRGHAIHVALALLWAFVQSITNAGEGIAWGMLLGINILRVPKVWWCWAPAWRDPLWWVMVAWFAWTSLTSAWGPDLGASTPSAIPDRWLFTPLMLWPVMGRPWLVLGAMAAGGVVHACVALVLSWKGNGWGTYGEVRGLSALNMAQWQFLSAFVLCVAGARWLGGVGRAAAIVVAVPAALGVWILAVRTVMAAAIAGCAVAFLRPLPRWRLRTWAIVFMGIVLGGAMVLRSPAWQRAADSFRQATELREVHQNSAAAEAASGGRLTLVEAAWDIGCEHPVIGGGAGWFEARLPQWALRQMAIERRDSELFTGLLQGVLNNAHSTILQAWVDGGIPAAALLAPLLFGLAWRLGVQSRSSPLAGAALALYSIVLMNVPFGIATTKAPGALIATCLAISWLSAGSCTRPRILQPKP
ncbi:MAG: O-antigen ligase family protein [Phycisphaerales bacterium]